MHKIWLFLTCCLALFLTGCWDEVYIEERGFVVGVALDLAEDYSEDNQKITLTNQLVVPSALGSPSEGGGSREKPYLNISGSGESLFEIIREMSKSRGNPAYYQHLKLIVVSEELAREPELFAGLMDLFIRDQEMRRGIRIIVGEDQAKNILDITPEMEPLPAMYINNINENTQKSAGLIQPLRIGQLHEHLLDKSNYLIPRVYPSDNQIHFKGAGIFNGKSNHLVGIIDDEEVIGVNLIKGNLQGGYIKFEVNDRLMIYEIQDADSNISINVDDPSHLHIDISIDTEGVIAEMFGERTLLDEGMIEDIQEQIDQKVEQKVNEVIQIGQEEMNMDFFGFNDLMQQKHYNTWEDIKENWEEGENIFQNSTVSVKAKTTVRTMGASDRVKNY